MNVLVYLVPIALALGGFGLAAFLWALKSGQFDDLDGAACQPVIPANAGIQRPVAIRRKSGYPLSRV